MMGVCFGILHLEGTFMMGRSAEFHSLLEMLDKQTLPIRSRKLGLFKVEEGG